MSGLSLSNGVKISLKTPLRLKFVICRILRFFRLKLMSQSEAKTRSKSMMISDRETFLSYTLIPVILGGMLPKSIFSNLNRLRPLFSNWTRILDSTFSFMIFLVKWPIFGQSCWMIELIHSARSWKKKYCLTQVFYQRKT